MSGGVIWPAVRLRLENQSRILKIFVWVSDEWPWLRRWPVHAGSRGTTVLPRMFRTSLVGLATSKFSPLLAEVCDKHVKHGPGCSASARAERSFGNSTIAPSRTRGPCLGSCSRRCSRLPAPDQPVRRPIELLAREGACAPVWNLLLPEEQDEAKQAMGNALIPA
jgi:hypothetical protein